MADLRPGELSEAELALASAHLWKDDAPAPKIHDLERAIATAAYAKAMKRAAEICRERATDGSFKAGAEAMPALYCAEAIEREAGK